VKEPGTNISASVRNRLTALARTRGLEFQRVLVLYALERLLYRLSVSPHAERFILKGASLFSLWLDEPHRRTRDLDLLGDMDLLDEAGPDPAKFVSLFQALCILSVEEDGMRFSPETVKAKVIREENAFGGLRVTMTAFLENARIAVQVDIGFGDAAVPEPQPVDFPTLLANFAAPHLLAYQKETTIAEKLHALVVLDRNNSRMKDFFDLYVLSEEFKFTQGRLSMAVRDAFAKRGTQIPAEAPDGLTQDFSSDAGKKAQWKAFLKQNVVAPRAALLLPEVIDALAAFLLPVLTAAGTERHEASPPEERIWSPGGPWK
jgi:hypothetical protein